MSDAAFGWKDFETHFDNLIPGIILSAELLAFGVLVPDEVKKLGGVERAALFVAASYAVGLVSALLSRLLLDAFSENCLRGLVFEPRMHRKRADLRDAYAQDNQFKQDLLSEKAKRSNEVLAQWNAIYRAALRRTKREPEIERRRAQGRLTRNLFFPAVLACALLVYPTNHWLSLVLGLLGGLLVCFLYSYAELNTLAEALDISSNDYQEPSGQPHKPS